MLDGPPYDVDKLNAELGARFDIAALVAEPYDSPGNREYRKARNAPGFAYSDERWTRLRREIDALSTEQIGNFVGVRQPGDAGGVRGPAPSDRGRRGGGQAGSTRKISPP